MRPTPNPNAQITLVMDGGGDLGVEVIFDPAETEPAVALQSVWEVDEGERKAIANGAPVHLSVWVGRLDPDIPAQVQLKALLANNRLTQPPVSIEVGAPAGPEDELLALLDRAHVERALGWLFGALNSNPPVGGVIHAADPEDDGLSVVVEHGPFDYALQHYEDSDEGPRWLGAGRVLDVEGWMRLAEQALLATRGAGDRAGTRDLALPTDVRRDVGE